VQTPEFFLITDRRCDGLVHSRRRLRASHGRRKHHRSKTGNHLPWRTAPCQGYLPWLLLKLTSV